MSSEFLWKFFKFGLVGFSGVFVDFGVTWLFRDQLRINQYVANSLGFATAVVSNYLLNRWWTFHSNDPNVAMQFGKFLIVALIGLGLNNAIIYALNGRLRIGFYIAKLVATGLVMIWNFGANYAFTFQR